ncbi:MAG TPA: hypothetical protein VGS19_27095 [Streptosporangiaceae bacterium]|nr:hypothetical protein [Streptosporangiaceae bacterium]
MTDEEHTTPGGAGPGTVAGRQDLVDEMKALRKRTRTQRHAYWFPLVLFGALIWASIPLYVQPQLPPHATQGLSGGVGWQQSFFSGAPGMVQAHLAYFWLAGLLGGLLVTQLWYRWHARRVGLQTPARGYLITTAVLTGLVLALPPLSGLRSPHWLRFLHWLSVLRPGDLTVRGLFPLLIIAAGLAALAWAERSQVLAVTAAIYTAAALLANLYNISNITYRLGWNLPPADESLPNVVLPGLVLLIVGAGACVAQRRRRAMA